MRTFLVIGDVHAPFIHKPTFGKILRYTESLNKKPDYIIQAGDLFDFYSPNRFAKNPNIISPDEEVLQGRAVAEELWLSLKHICPKAICYQIRGNHCDRPNKKLMALAPELFSFFTPKPLWAFPGVNTINDSRDELVIEDIVFQHGHRGKLGDHAKFNRRKTVVGHSHQGNLILLPEFGGKDLIWELNCGYIADPTHECLRYSPQRFNKWIHGFGIIDELGPRFIPTGPLHI